MSKDDYHPFIIITAFHFFSIVFYTEQEVKKPEQFVQLTSPYVNYKVSPIPIPTEM